jgi:hypothetical protein
MVTVKSKKDENTFDVSKAKFTGYKDAAEIKAGDKVNATYNKAGDKLMAESFGKAEAAAPATCVPTSPLPDQVLAALPREEYPPASSSFST